MLAEKQFKETEEMKAKAQITYAQPDDLNDFYHLKSTKVKLNYFPFIFLLWNNISSLCVLIANSYFAPSINS